MSNEGSLVARVVVNVRRWLGGIALGCGIWCGATQLCPVEAGAVKLPAKTCLNAYQNFTVKTTRKDSGRISAGALPRSRAYVPVHGCVAIVVHQTTLENGHLKESEMPQAPFPCSSFQVIAFPRAMWR